MPKFVTFFKSFNAKLPLPTRMLLGVSNFVEHTGGSPSWRNVLCSSVGTIMHCDDPTTGKAWLDSMILKLAGPG